MEIPMTITSIVGRVDTYELGDRGPRFIDQTVRATDPHGQEVTWIATADGALVVGQQITVTITTEEGQ